MEARTSARIFIHAFVVLACLVIVLPFVWILLVSLKHAVDIYSGTFRFQPTFDNFRELLFTDQGRFLLNLKNSIVVGAVSTVIVVLVATLAAHALSRFRWPRIVPAVFLAGVLLLNMIPRITLVGPWYLMFRSIGLYNSLTGLIILHTVLNMPMSVWLMLKFVSDVPKELEESAFLDGCKHQQVFVRVVTPLVTPGLAASAVLAFIFSWNEFPVALNLTGTATATVPVAVSKLAQQYQLLYGEMAASAVLATIPGVILMFVGQRFVVKGLTLGALK